MAKNTLVMRFMKVKNRDYSGYIAKKIITL